MNTKVEVFEGYVFGQKRVPPVDPGMKGDALRLSIQIEQEGTGLAPERLGNKALILLLEQKLDRNEQAVELLSEAVAEDPQNAQLLSDLAAALLAPSSSPGPPGRFRALAAADRAVRLEPDLLEARFNLALALEKSGLFRQAQRAWVDFLRLDSQSDWAADAREYLNNLRQPSRQDQWRKVIKKQALSDPLFTTLAFIYFQAAREDATEEVLARWASLEVAGDQAGAARELESAHKIGFLLVNSRYDATVSDAVDVISKNRGKQAEPSLSHAHIAYGQGLKLFRMGRPDLALPQLESAAKNFSSAGSPLEHWANLVIAEIACRDSKFTLAAQLISRIRAHANLAKHKALNEHLIFLEGLSQFLQLNFQNARQSFDSLTSLHHSELEGAARFYLARINSALGDKSWLYRNMASSELSRFPHSKYTVDLFLDFADALAQEYPEAAFYLLSEAMEASRDRKDIGKEIEALNGLAKLENMSGSIHLAQRRLAALKPKIEALARSAFATRLALEHDILRCEIDASFSTACLDVLTNAVEFYKQYDRTQLFRIYGLRARAYKKMGHTLLQEGDLSAGIDLYDGLKEPLGLPLSSLIQAQLLLEEIVLANLSQNNIPRALEFEERSRSILLPTKYSEPSEPDSLGYAGNNLGDYSCQEFLEEIPKRVTLVEFKISGEILTAWIFRNRGVRHVDLPISRTALIQHLQYKPLRSRLISSRIASPSLANWLIQPLSPWLPDEGDLFFLTDPILDSVDFAGLEDPRTQQSLGKALGIGKIPKSSSDFSLDGDNDLALEVFRRTLCPGAPNGLHTDELTFVTDQALSSLPHDAALLEYALLEGRFYVWILHKGRIDFVRLTCNPSEVKENLDNLLLGMRRSRPTEVHESSTSLYESLIVPALPYLSKSRSLIIVPDGVLSSIPFAALENPATGRHLIEDYPVSVSPSASLYIKQSSRGRSSSHANWTVIAVSNPITDGSFDNSSLAGAASEARNIVRLLPGSELFEGQKALSPEAYSSLKEHEILHIASHWDPRRLTYEEPVLTSALLATPNVRLVVLAACQTAIDPLRRSPNGWGTVDHLLARGTPAVVASLWRVDDSATKHLLVKFYEHLREGKDGASALRAAQLDLLHGEDPALRDPASWAGFQIFGFGGI